MFNLSDVVYLLSDIKKDSNAGRTLNGRTYDETPEIELQKSI